MKERNEMFNFFQREGREKVEEKIEVGNGKKKNERNEMCKK